MYCIFCGNEIECEYEGLDKNGRLEQYHCDKCDTLYTLRNEDISYIRSATSVLTCVYEDLKLNKKIFL